MLLEDGGIAEGRPGREREVEVGVEASGGGQGGGGGQRGGCRGLGGQGGFEAGAEKVEALGHRVALGLAGEGAALAFGVDAGEDDQDERDRRRQIGRRHRPGSPASPALSHVHPEGRRPAISPDRRAPAGESSVPRMGIGSA